MSSPASVSICVPSSPSLLTAQSLGTVSLSTLNFPLADPFGFRFFSHIPITQFADPNASNNGNSSSVATNVDAKGEEFDAKHNDLVAKLRSIDWTVVKRCSFDDYYGLLGLEDKKYNSTTEEIKVCWRILQRLCHPDKAKNEDRDDAELRFKALQMGVETLTDPSRRKGYDSSLPFDDSLPRDSEGTTEKTFFSVYGPVFQRNERFSIRRPCPPLGDINTPDDQVREFYHFWTTFDSWREFADLNESKPENAGYREEKRRLERENKKKQESRKKEEMKRVFKLADDALRKDPRIKRMDAEAEAAKKSKKEAKFAVQRAAEEAKKKEIEDAKKAAEEAANAEKAARESEKTKKLALKSMRSYLGKYLKNSGFAEDVVTKLKESLSLEEMTFLVGKYKAEGKQAEEATEIVKAHLAGGKIQISAIEGKAEEKTAAPKEEKKEEKKDDKKEVVETKDEKEKEKEKEKSSDSSVSLKWSLDEEALLTRAVVRYPGGVKERWEKITEMVNSAGGKRNVKEVIRKQKEVESGLGTNNMQTEDAYQLYLKKMNKTDLLDAHKEQIAVTQSASSASSSPSDGPLDELQQRILQQKVDAETLKEQKESKAKAKEAKTATPPAADVWAPAEQKAFEKGLADVSKDAADRWDQIAALVGTKNSKQCHERFKHIRDEILKAKAKK